MIDKTSFHLIHENEKFILGHYFEDVYLSNKWTNENIYLGDFYGDPACGLIASDNTFCVVGGIDKLVLFRKNEIIQINEKELIPACEIRQTDLFYIQILLDPWSDKPAIWQFNVITLEKQKIRDFPYYKDKEYTEDIHW